MSTIQTPTRVFIMGTTRLTDIDPSMPPAQVVDAYVPSYPHLANAMVSEPEVVGDELHYTIEKPPVKTKG